MSLPRRNSVKVLLLNEEKKLLLLCAEDPTTRPLDGEPLDRFWYLVGGRIESQETLEEAALREIYEETAIGPEDVELGPVVWHGECDLILSGRPTHLVETFIVAKTKQRSVSLANATPEERLVIKDIAWFSLEEIESSKETIFPLRLPQYLPDILQARYPRPPLTIDLTAMDA